MKSRPLAATLALIFAIGMTRCSVAEPQVPGPALGEKAPEFQLKDQSGKTRSLSDFVGKEKKVALVFYRSADW